MANKPKRVLALLIAVIMLVGMLPTIAFAAEEKQVSADELWQQIQTLEYSRIPAKRGTEVSAERYADLTDSVITLVENCSSYKDGTIDRHGDFFFWEMEDGEVCGYSPRLRAEIRNSEATGAAPEDVSGVETVSFAARGGAPSSTTVSVFQPYYGLDSSFTTQYANEGTSIANALGGTRNLYKTTAATIDQIADALETSAVVIFDSHGDTDYASGEDYTSRANTSYLCLQTGTGLTSADQKQVSGTYGNYYHAYNAGSGSNGMKYYCVDGTAIANHMDCNAPNSILWSAICLGMATDGLHAPLRAKGVEVAYGYSQSVTFWGDFMWEEEFWDQMIAEKTVAQSVSSMKSKYGSWDCSKEMYDADGYSYDNDTCTSAADAKSKRSAFPIVVSSEDAYPGHGNVDAVQTVKSSYTLYTQEEPDPCTITLKAGTSTYQTVSTTTNTTATLPNYTGTLPTGYTFAGWTTGTITGTTQTAPTLYNGSYSTGSATSVTLYACFSKSEAGQGGGTGTEFELYSGSITEGDYLITDSGKTAMKATVSNDRLGYASVSPSNDVISNPDALLIWHIEASGNYYTIYNASVGKYAASTGAKNKAALSDSATDDKSLWTASGTSSYEFVNKKNTANSVNSYLRYNPNIGFAAYGTGTGNALTLYKAGAGSVTTYTTTITTCSHSNMQTIAANAATCTATGNNTYYHCPTCDGYFTDAQGKNPTTVAAQTTPMVNHTYGAWTSNNNKTHTKECSVCHNKVTENCTFTSVVSGATVTYTCSACKYSYQETKDVYTISYNVLGSVVNTVPCVEGESVTLPATATAVDGFTFAGWVKNTIGTETATAPAVLTGSYKPTDNITLYAVYSRTEEGGTGGGGNYKKVTSTADLTDGQYLIVYETGKVALDGSLSTIDAVKNTVGITFSGDDIVSDSNTEKAAFTFSASGKSFLGTNGKYLNCNTAKKLNLSDTAVSHTISFSNGNAAINAGSYLRFNKASDQMRFRCYASGQEDIQLYKAGAGSTTYYTTAPEVATPCEHANLTPTAAVAATCENPGNNAYWFCSDCNKYFKEEACETVTTVEAETIAALGHDYNGTVSQKDAAYHTVQCTRCDSTQDQKHTFADPVISGTTASHTCTVCEYSEPVTAYTVTFCASSLAADTESPLSAQTVVAGGKVTAPTPAAKEGFTFLGWYTQSGSWTSDPGILTAAQINAAAVNANCTYYGVWAEGDTNPTVFTRTTDLSDLTDGTQVIIVSNYNKKAITTTAGAVDVTVTDNTVPATASNIWTIGKSGTSYKFKANDKYLTLSSKTVSVGTSGTSFTVVKSDNTKYPDSFWIRTGTDYLEYNNGWVGYTLNTPPTSSGAAGYVSNDLYISKTVISEYTTSPAICAHSNMEPVAEVAPKCEAAGSNAYYHCPDCGKDFKDAAGNTPTTAAAETIAALGHDYNGTVSQKDAAYHTVKCTRCDSTQDQKHTFADPVISGTTASHTCTVCEYSEPVTAFTVTYSVPTGIAAVPAETVAEGSSVTLPTAGTVDGYTFAGWVTAAIGEETTVAPAILTGSYKPTSDIMLYALYIRIEAGEGGEPGYYLAAEIPAVGDNIIIAIKDGNNWYALPNGNTKSTDSISGEALTVTNGCAADTEDITFEVIENKSDTGIKSTAGDYYLGLNSGKLAMNGWGDTKPIAFTAGTESGTYYIVGTKSGDQGNEGRALDFSGSVFSCDAENGGSPVYIFTYTEGGSGDTTYYTTAPVVETPCTHENTTLTGAVAATCEAPGYTGDYVCDECHIVVTAGTEIPALGHDLAWDGVVGNGTNHVLACSRCAYTENEACTMVNGICTVCGYKIVDIESAALSLDNDIDISYAVEVPADSTNVYMVFEMNGVETTVADDGSHTFLFEGVNPQCMGDNVSATLHATVDGVEYTDAQPNYSVLQYCRNKLADESISAELRTMLSDMLAYGTAAQNYVGYKTGELVTNSELTDPTYSTFAPISGYAPVFNGDAASDVYWVSAGLTLTNNVAMNFTFHAESIDGLSIKVTLNGREKVFEAKDFVAVDGKANTYRISFTGILADEFEDTVTAAFFRGGAQVGNSLTYSVNTYVCAKQADGDANLAALVKALYNYGASAKAYADIGK